MSDDADAGGTGVARWLTGVNDAFDWTRVAIVGGSTSAAAVANARIARRSGVQVSRQLQDSSRAGQKIGTFRQLVLCPDD